MKTLTVNAAAGATGTAETIAGPSYYGEVWHVDRARLSCTVSNHMPRAWLSVAGSHRIEGTYTGAEDTTVIDADLMAGQRIIGEWEGAAPGSICTLTILYEPRIDSGGAP